MAEKPVERDPLDLIEVVSGGPSAEEVAAAKAVIAGMLREGGSVDATVTVDRWSESARSGRTTLERGIHSWDDLAR